MTSPPRLAALLLRLSVRSPEISEAILGDLEQELAGLTEAGLPPRHPRLWYWWAVLGLSRRFALASWPRPGPRGSASALQSGFETAGTRGDTLETLAQDLKCAFRSLRKSPGFTVASVLTLTVGIGANVAMFSVVEPTLLRPLPYEEPDRLVMGLGTVEGHSSDQTVSAHDYADLRDRSTAFESLGARTAWPWFSSLTGGEEPLRLPVGWVSVNFFQTLGVEPILGRAFRAEEGTAGTPNVAILSHSIWVQNFGSDPEVVGRSVNVDGRPFTIVGVMPPGFRIWTDCDLWMPMRLGQGFAEDRRYQNFVMIGRLRRGVPMEQAQSQIDVITRDLAAEYPATNGGKGFRLAPLQEVLTRGYRASLLLLVGGVGLLLLIACGNLAALLLARGFGRRTEFSVRMALGASKGRILRQSLAESLVVALVGGGMGTLVALATHTLIVTHLPFQVPSYTAEAGISLSMLGFVLLLSAGTGVLVGTIPGLRSGGRDAAEGLRSGPRSVDSRGTRIRNALVVAQVALSMLLLMGSGLLIRSVLHLRSVDPGFVAEGLIAADLELPPSDYRNGDTRRTFLRSLDERIRAIPGVVDLAMIDRLPIRGMGGNTYVYPVGERPATGEQARTANERWVMPGYFHAMGIPVLRGRGIELTDGPDAPPVLVINETMANEFFPGQDPLGQRLIIDYDEETVLEVVGVVKDVRFDGPAHGAFQAMYHSYLQEPVTRVELGVRVAGEASSVIPSLRRAVRALDPNLPLSEVERMDRVISRTMGDQAAMAVVLTFFAWVAALLTALGLYGVLSYYVNQRRPELGLRLALGADPIGLIRLVALRGLSLLAVGMVLGTAGAIATTRFLEVLLVGVVPNDPLTFLVVCALFVMVGVTASALPARRAVRVDPVKVLQAE